MPLANAAFIADVKCGDPMIWASGVPPCCSMNCFPSKPGCITDPDIIAERVSRMWCLVFVNTLGGNSEARALDMYSIRRGVMELSVDIIICSLGDLP